ncbi:hypothetical protein ILYODFUR_000791 [Ilyodon furcidens]|uniref:Uncharacterized protein n=1 Tax=Ilyodon furcidens TaxID=33524 RepID=A0ABV0TTS5_9TELE
MELFLHASYSVNTPPSTAALSPPPLPAADGEKIRPIAKGLQKKKTQDRTNRRTKTVYLPPFNTACQSLHGASSAGISCCNETNENPKSMALSPYKRILL